MKIEAVKKYNEAYDAYINGTDDEFCSKYGIDRNAMARYVKTYLEKFGVPEEIKEYKKRKCEVMRESKRKNMTLDCYKPVKELLNNMDNFEFVMNELRKQNNSISFLLESYYNICDEKDKENVNTLLRYYKDSRLLRKIDRTVEYNNNRINQALKPVDESVYNYVKGFIESVEVSNKAYDLKNGNNDGYLNGCMARLKKSKNPRVVALVDEFREGSKNPFERFKKYHPELIDDVKNLYLKIIEGNFCSVDFYLEREEELPFETYKALSKCIKDNSKNLRKNRVFIGTMDDLLNVDTIEYNLLSTKLIFKDYGEVESEVNTEVVNYMKKNNIPLKFPLFRQLIIKYVNNELSLENAKVLKKTK